MTRKKRKLQQDAETPPSSRTRQFALFYVALLLLAASWAWVRWAPIRRTPEYELEDVSFGVNILIAGAVPWLLQWAGITSLLLGLCSFTSRWKRKAVLMAAVVPLVVGVPWWIGVISTHWSEDPLEAMTTMFAQAFARQHGAETLGQGVLYDVLGPLTAPFLLRGPYSLTGWDFVLVGLSTAAVICLFLPVAQANNGATPRLRVYVLIAVIWTSPVLIRAVMRVATVF